MAKQKRAPKSSEDFEAGTRRRQATAGPEPLLVYPNSTIKSIACQEALSHAVDKAVNDIAHYEERLREARGRKAALEFFIPFEILPDENLADVAERIIRDLEGSEDDE